jgi:hypothetical protein
MTTNAESKPDTKDLKEAEDETSDDYGRNLLMERIALANRQVHVAMPNEVFVGPTTYDRFLHCFMSLLKKKEGEIKNLLNDSRYGATPLPNHHCYGTLLRFLPSDRCERVG